MSFSADALRGTFLEEARELLASMQMALLEFAQTGDQTETVQAVFRAAHTIKGSAGLFGLNHVVRFAHTLESLLESLRSEPSRLTQDVAKTLLDAHDELDRVIEAMTRDEVLEASAALFSRLEALGGTQAQVAPTTQQTNALPSRRWRLEVQFGSETFRDGFDPLSFLRFLEGLSEVEAVETITTRLPAQGFDPETCFLSFVIELKTSAPPEKVVSTFDFVRDGSTIAITELTRAPEAAASAPTQPGPAPTDVPMVKVPAPRLDVLVDMVSELVIAGAAAEVCAASTRDRSTLEAFATVRKLVAGIRDAALSLRMVQIGETFNRYRRVIREVSAQLGKEVEVELRGGETELDKAMVARLADPLLHIVRNAIDHGVEAPEARVAAGKPRAGKLTLEAQHQAGQVVIDVRDDGAGLNRARLRRKAIERGLISANDVLTDAEVDELIFTPGFSSADVVTDISGRGVGMDVVRRSIDALRGTVEVLSTEGQGTTMRLRLPLMLAIIDGFLLGVGEASFVVPSKLVRECLDFHTLLESEENHRLKLREQAVPYVRLREFFGLPGKAPRRESVVIIEYGEQTLALVVDRLLGVSQTVIKPLGPLFTQLPGIGGTTILGSGGVGLIIDVPQLIRAVSMPGHRAATSNEAAQRSVAASSPHRGVHA
ncbi:MAG: chemotaxis protein CheA [Archangium sp.]|nr:chemotaxis protein CheA [Archangium sp.]